MSLVIGGLFARRGSALPWPGYQGKYLGPLRPLASPSVEVGGSAASGRCSLLRCGLLVVEAKGLPGLLGT